MGKATEVPYRDRRAPGEEAAREAMDNACDALIVDTVAVANRPAAMEEMQSLKSCQPGGTLFVADFTTGQHAARPAISSTRSSTSTRGDPDQDGRRCARAWRRDRNVTASPSSSSAWGEKTTRWSSRSRPHRGTKSRTGDILPRSRRPSRSSTRSVGRVRQKALSDEASRWKTSVISRAR